MQRFETLKNKLDHEGLFDKNNNVDSPLFPQVLQSSQMRG